MRARVGLSMRVRVRLRVRWAVRSACSLDGGPAACTPQPPKSAKNIAIAS